MWTAPKTSDIESAANREIVDPTVRDAVRRLWIGLGRPEDRDVAAAFIERAHEEGLWVACDCRGEEQPPAFPLMAPAYLRGHGTYYLRRLFGETRPLHAKSCPFYGEPALGHDAVVERAAPARPDGYFLLDRYLIGAPVSRSQTPGGPSGRTRGAPTTNSPSMLRRQFWRLIEQARLNRIRPPVRGQRPSYRLEYASLKDAAEALLVDEGTPLARVFETVPTAIERRSIYAKIREAAKDADEDAPLQGYVCFYAGRVSEKAIIGTFAETPFEITPTYGVDVGGGEGPYLVLVLIGPTKSGDLQPLKAVAQPVLNGRRFFPVFDAGERARIDALIGKQFAVAKANPNLKLSFERPLFGDDQEHVPGALIALLTSMETGAIYDLDLTAARMLDQAPESLASDVTEWALSCE
ncbi:MAG: hypothetical protein AAFR28_05220 [Pseudomonadota bacterium]